MTINRIIEFLTGIALFLYGMSLMSGSIQKVANTETKSLLGKMTDNAFQGVLFGTGVTALIQSSSATSVMCISFVNGDMMSLKQAKSVILGAIFGTSITGWILCLNDIGGEGVVTLFSTVMITFLAAIIGTVLRMLRNDKLKVIGNVLLGFAVLMAGMNMMSDSVIDMRENAAFLSFLTDFSNPIIGILVGCMFAAILQSASASVGVLQALAPTGIITFRIALPLIIGISIGAALPVLLAAPESSANGKKAAFFYLISTFVSAIIITVIIYFILHLLGNSFVNNVMSSYEIALVNTVYRLFSVLIVLPALLYKGKKA